MDAMKISIIIPVYNVAPYIEECLNSVIAQTYKGEMECILVDDCGTDDSVEICERIISRYNGPLSFRIVHHEHNRGLSAARNTGIRSAKGDSLYFLDSDDRIYPHTIATLVSLAEKYPGVDMVQGNTEVEPHDSWMYGRLHYAEGALKEYWSDREEVRKLLLGDVLPMTAWNKLVRREFIIQYDLFFREGFIHEDEIWRWDCQKYIQTLAISPVNTLWYRIDNQMSIMTIGDKTRSVISLLELFEHASLQAYTDYELEFAQQAGKLYRRYNVWAQIRDKESVMNKAKTVYATLSKTHLVSSSLRHLAFMWTLPYWVINNRFFIKFYYEWSKRNIISV